MAQLSEYVSDSGHRKAVIQLVKETLSVDFYENDEYIWTIEYPDKSIHFVEDAAENWTLGIFNNVKDYNGD